MSRSALPTAAASADDAPPPLLPALPLPLPLPSRTDEGGTATTREKLILPPPLPPPIV